MEIPRYLEIPPDKEQAIALQQKYAKEIVIGANSSSLKLVAGTDVSYDDQNNKAYAAIVVIDRENGEVVERATWIGDIAYPYRPGFFAFREIPCLLKAFQTLQTIPDVILVDGNGILHPRRFGLACHLGLCMDMSTIGCAKSLLLGVHNRPSRSRGAIAPIRNNDQIVGAAIRTQLNSPLLYVSIGHRIDQESANAIVIDLTKSSREPIPLLYAHNMSTRLRISDQSAKKDRHLQKILSEIENLRKQGLSYRIIADQLNKNEIQPLSGKKFTAKAIRKFLENFS